MNVLVWIVQAALAFLYLAGGAYKTFSFDAVASTMPEVPRAVWTALGAIEMVGGVLLIVPAATGWMPILTAHAAALLAVETFALAVIYARHSTDLTLSNPLLWAVVMGLAVAFVAYGRYTLRPSG